eukprot:NODE_428_length_8761_cov_0.779612.p2 type:complete len:354 gc:universal NODE_428_length_8761_cov_0.779612:7331-8392(+)
MFYSVDFLCGNNGLSVCWLASTMGSTKSKRLSKKMINNVDIQEQVNFLLNPVEPLALRLSSHLLLGILRVYKQQYEFYSADVQQAITKLMSMNKKPSSRPPKFDLDLNQLNHVSLDFEDKDFSWDTDSNLFPNSQINMNIQPVDLESMNLSISGSEDKLMELVIEHSSNDLGGFDLSIPSAPPVDFSSQSHPQPEPLTNVKSSIAELTSTVPHKRSRSAKPYSSRKYMDAQVTAQVEFESFKWYEFQSKIMESNIAIPFTLPNLEIGRFGSTDIVHSLPSLGSQEVGRNESYSGSAGAANIPAFQSDSSDQLKIGDRILSSDQDINQPEKGKSIYGVTEHVDFLRLYNINLAN